MRENKWSKGVNPRPGRLHGWSDKETPEARHAAIGRSLRDGGYDKTVERLVFIANVANRRNNLREHATALEDLGWLERQRAAVEEDQRRRMARDHRVTGHTRADGDRVPEHRQRNPYRRPRRWGA